MLELIARQIPGLERLPCANSGRLWLMRLGLYARTREKPKADDWVWMIDHTVQLGPWKCLAIVGVRLSAWNPQRGPLKPEDLTLFNLTPMEQSTGEAVAEQRQATIQQTEIVPAAVLSDEGAELKTGMKLLQQERAEGATWCTSTMSSIRWPRRLERTPAVIKRAQATVRVDDVMQRLCDKLGLTLPAQQALALPQNKNVPQIQQTIS